MNNRTIKRKGHGARNPGHFAATTKQYSFREAVTHLAALTITLLVLGAATAAAAIGCGVINIGDGPATASNQPAVATRWAGPNDPCGTAAIGGGCALPHSKTPQAIQVTRPNHYRVKCGKTYSTPWDLGTQWGGIVCEKPQYNKQLKKQGFHRMHTIKKGSHHEPPIN